MNRATRRKNEKYNRTGISRANSRNEDREKMKQRDERNMILRKRNEEAQKRSEKRDEWRRKIGAEIGVSYKRIVLTSSALNRSKPSYSIKSN